MTSSTHETQRAPIAGHEHVFEPSETSPWTLLMLHGTGGDEHDLVPLGQQLAPDAAILSPAGNVLEGGVVRRFFARRSANDIDVDDMLQRSDELATFIREATATYELDADRIVAVGYSNGANIALSTMLAHPGLLRGAALMRPVLYYQPAPLPDLSGTDVITVAGARDPYTPPPTLAQLASVLDQTGAAHELHVDPAAGHPLVQSDLGHVARWVRELTA